MSYEAFRSEVALKLQEAGVCCDLVGKIIPVLDSVSSRYDIGKKPTELSIMSDEPELMKLYLASKAVENLSKGSLKQYRYALRKFFKEVRKPISMITTNDIRVYLYNFKDSRNVKDSYVNGMRVVLNGFFEWLAQEEYIDKNPVKRIAQIKYSTDPRKPLTEIELERMRSSCETLRQKALIDFLFSTGCRLAELTALTINDVDFEQGEVYIKHGKGDKARTTYLNARSIVSLKAYLASRTDDCPGLFVTGKKPFNQMSKRAVQVEINTVTALAGLNRTVSPHIFRHTAATTALKRGMSIEQVQRFLGHSKMDTTLIYAKVDNSTVKASHIRCVS